MELSPAMMQFAVFIPIIIAFYFLLIRPQQKRQREQQQMLDSLQRNDRVVTSGGLFGRITKVNGNEVGLEISDNVEITILRSAIAQKLQSMTKSNDRVHKGRDMKQKNRKHHRRPSAESKETQKQEQK